MNDAARLCRPRNDPLKEIRTDYGPCDFHEYAERLERAEEGDFPAFVLARRECYARCLRQMSGDPSCPKHVQAMNALRLMDRTGASR